MSETKVFHTSTLTQKLDGVKNHSVAYGSALFPGVYIPKKLLPFPYPESVVITIAVPVETEKKES